MRNYPNAALGLRYVFYGELLGIAYVFLFWVPLLGLVLSVAANVLHLLGLYRASSEDEGYRMAFYASVVNLVAAILGTFVLSSLMQAVCLVLNMVSIYFVCITTSNLLYSLGSLPLSNRGRLVWKINLGCTVVSVAVTMMMLLPGLVVAGAMLGLVVSVVTLVGYIMYVLFLSQSCKVLA